MSSKVNYKGELYRLENSHLGQLLMLVGEKGNLYTNPYAPEFLNGRIIIAPNMHVKKLQNFIATSDSLLSDKDSSSERMAQADYYYHEAVFDCYKDNKNDLILINLCTNREFRRKKLASQVIRGVAMRARNNKFSKIIGASSLSAPSFYESLPECNFNKKLYLFSIDLNDKPIKSDAFIRDPEGSEAINEFVQGNDEFFRFKS